MLLVLGLADALVFAVEVIGPVPVEVAVADDGSEPEDGFGSGQSPPGSGDLQAVADQVPGRSLDRAGGDGPALLQGVVVVQMFACSRCPVR